MDAISSCIIYKGKIDLEYTFNRLNLSQYQAAIPLIYLKHLVFDEGIPFENAYETVKSEIHEIYRKTL
jgi:hypothetical protein